MQRQLVDSGQKGFNGYIKAGGANSRERVGGGTWWDRVGGAEVLLYLEHRNPI